MKNTGSTLHPTSLSQLTFLLNSVGLHDRNLYICGNVGKFMIQSLLKSTSLYVNSSRAHSDKEMTNILLWVETEHHILVNNHFIRYHFC